MRQPSDELSYQRESREVRICRRCSHLADGPLPPPGLCNHEWIAAPLAEDMGVESSVLQPHPDGGWPEVRVTRVYVIHSDDPRVVERERLRLVQEAAADA